MERFDQLFWPGGELVEVGGRAGVDGSLANVRILHMRQHDETDLGMSADSLAKKAQHPVVSKRKPDHARVWPKSIQLFQECNGRPGRRQHLHARSLKHRDKPMALELGFPEDNHAHELNQGLRNAGSRIVSG